MAFFELTHPTRIIPDFPGANGWLAAITGVVLLLEGGNVRVPRIPWTAVAYLALCAASVLWSINRSDTLLMTLLYSWIALFACICVAQTDTQTLLRGIAWGGVMLVAVTLISVVVDPERFGGGLLFPGSGPGVHGSRGVVAYSLVLALCAALARRDSRWLRRIEIGLTVLVNLTVVVIAPSATGRVGVVAILLSVLPLAFIRRLHGRRLVWAWAVIVGLAAVVVVVGIQNADLIAAALDRSADFSGRFAVWQAIIPAWLEAPILGYGFGAVWFYGWWRLDGSPVLTQMNEAAKIYFYHGHNIVFDVLPQLGALGLVAVLLLLGLLLVRGVRGFRELPDAATWAVLTLIAIVVMGITEPMLSVPVGWFCVVAATAASRREPLILTRTDTPGNPG